GGGAGAGGRGGAEGAAAAGGSPQRPGVYDNTYEPMKRNRPLADAFRVNMQRVGVPESPELKERLGSSDVGNISQVIPTIQPYVKIAPDGTPRHSRALPDAAARPLARERMLAAAKIMAMTTLDLLTEPGLLDRAKADFQGGVR